LAAPRQPQGTPMSPTTSVPSSLERVHLSYCTNLSVNGIGALLNNCPRIAHLSLTGITAFLRDELLCFCRDAPPNFTDHQRDNFCVFSGPGVGRLRNFLNDQAQAARMASPHYYGADGQDEDDDVEMADARAPSVDDSVSAGSPARSLIAPPVGIRVGMPTAMPGTMTTAYRTALPPTSAPISPAVPPPRPQSLPNAFGSSAMPPARQPHDLPPLRIPQRATQRLGLGFLPDAQSPTHDQPLSLDEGEEYIPDLMGEESEDGGPALARADRNP
jgi:F-box and leucine-rich repeat protein GRR1